MELLKLFSMQHCLDQRIVEEHQLQEKNLINEKIVALQVELGELANETRCFKFWSLKPPAEANVILEEYVDGLHFILSIGNDLNFNKEIQLKNEGTTENLVEQFLNVFDSINTFWKENNIEHYTNLFSDYLFLGHLLGFSEADIEKAYDEKNKVNHVRQDQGY